MSIIKSISYDQTEILEWIMRLYCPGGFDCDPTYSRGSFYKSGRIPEPAHKYDINPQCDGVEQLDCRNILDTGTKYNSIVFDPPFLATKGPSLKCDDDRNLMAKRFGVYPTMNKLWQFYSTAIWSLYHALNDNGLLVFKCQDCISSGKQWLSHNYIINQAEGRGFYTQDLFILLAKSRLIANWQLNQKHSRKFHSYFIVFRKRYETTMDKDKLEQLWHDHYNACPFKPPLVP